jgi:hypothetical protein
MRSQELLLGNGQVEERGGGQAEIGEVQAPAIDQNVPEVGVEVEQATGIHEGDSR